MMNKNCIGLLAGCLLLLAPAAGALAVDGIQLGPTILYPVLSVSGTYDDNIHLVSKDRESGWIASVAPSVRVVMPVRSFYLNLEGGLDFVTYLEIDQDNHTDGFVGGAVGAEFPGGLSFKLSDRQEYRYLVGSQEYGVVLDENAQTTGEDYALNTLDAKVGYAIRDAVRLEFSGVRTVANYSISKRRERTESTVQGDLFWKFRPTLSGILEGSYTMYEYETNTAQDNNAAQAAVGLSWDLTAKSTGVAKVGYQWKRYDDPDSAYGTEDASYLTTSVGLKHYFTPRTLLNVDVSRASQESDFPENPYFVRNTVDLMVMQRITAKVFGRVGLRYGIEDYPNSASFDNPFTTEADFQSGVRKDTSIAWSAAVGFNMTRWLTLEAEYGGGHRESNFDTFDYDVNRVSLSAKAAF